MSLAAMQEMFLDGLADPEERDSLVLADTASAGYAIYRNAYRTVLVDALKETFPRTLAYTGDEPFQAAAAHHLIQTPPSSWSLDHAGRGFDAVLAELFAENPEVAELAALEWAMHTMFVAADVGSLNVSGFAQATATFVESDWATMQLRMIPLATVACRYDLLSWWKDADTSPQRLDTPMHASVWREDERPVFIAIDESEAQALAMIRQGASFGTLCERLLQTLPEAEAVPLAGTYLQNWLHRGWLAGVTA